MAKYPEPVFIVIVKTRDGHFNPMSASWAMFTSISPPMVAISIGFSRFTFELIQEAGEFVLCIPSEFMAEEVNHFGSYSGRDQDKLKVLGTSTQPASVIDNVLLAEAAANFECKVRDTLVTGDHMIFSAEIVASHRHKDALKRLFVLEKKVFGGTRPLDRN